MNEGRKHIAISSQAPVFGFEEETAKKIIEIITGNAEVDKIILFGSRATGDFSERSDIDLAVDSSEEILHLKQILEEEVPTLLKFDLVDLKKVNDGLKKEILKQGRILYEKV